MLLSMQAKRLEDFNREYLALHVKKEDLFWSTYMGVDDHSEALQTAENELKSYCSDPLRFQEIRAALKELDAAGNSGVDVENERRGLEGWLAFFDAQGIESELGRKLQAELVQLESELFSKRAKVRLSFRDSQGIEQEGSTNVMATHISTSRDENVRKTAHQALLSLEQWVLNHGFIELVRKRNEFSRALGFANYFEYKIKKLEGMTTPELFLILDDFEKRTREPCRELLNRLKKEKGEASILAHNLRFSIAGDVNNQADPYFPFEKSLETWVRSFARLGIRFRGATLSLDLLDRKGKYENGFMHGPQPCFYDRGRWQPARINFTSNATPSQIGSGRSGLITLFHEGGHAAHFSNITLNAPCFSQEFPPTSMAFAETQSMFCDSLIQDADWLKLYAQSHEGESIPDSLIRLMITHEHPSRAFQERSILVVPYFEYALYSMDEAELSPERVTELARRKEQEILGIQCSPRPLLAIPHLLGGDGACSYQGYLLAHMAVYQTRAYFLKKYGYITDNPQVGPELEKAYWNPGNQIRHSDAVYGLTGESLSGRALAEYCNVQVEALWVESEKKIRAALARSSSSRSSEMNLDARIRIVHGAQEITNNESSMQKMVSDFQEWIKKQRLS